MRVAKGAAENIGWLPLKCNRIMGCIISVIVHFNKVTKSASVLCSIKACRNCFCSLECGNLKYAGKSF